MEQAQAWVEAAAEDPDKDSFDPEFLREIEKMGREAQKNKGQSFIVIECFLSFFSSFRLVYSKYTGDVSQNDASTTHNGVFSSALRLQPRYQQGASATYDKVVQQQVRAEKRAKAKAEAQKGWLSFFIILVFSRT